MSLGLLSHCRGCLNKSGVAAIRVVMFHSENGASLLIGLLGIAIATCMEAILTTVKEGCYYDCES